MSLKNQANNNSLMLDRSFLDSITVIHLEISNCRETSKEQRRKYFIASFQAMILRGVECFSDGKYFPVLVLLLLKSRDFYFWKYSKPR